MKELFALMLVSGIFIAPAFSQAPSVPKDGQSPQKVVSLVFKNTSLSKIPLDIPGVMQANLSPMSTSNADVPVGTVISYYKQKKAIPLITITADTPKELIVNKLIAEKERANKG